MAWIKCSTLSKFGWNIENKSHINVKETSQAQNEAKMEGQIQFGNCIH